MSDIFLFIVEDDYLLGIFFERVLQTKSMAPKGKYETTNKLGGPTLWLIGLIFSNIFRLNNEALNFHCKFGSHRPDCSLTYFGFFHMYDLGVSYTFHFREKNAEWSVIFLRNGVLILDGKENKETTTICFEIRITKKKNYIGIITESSIQNL